MTEFAHTLHSSQSANNSEEKMKRLILLAQKGDEKAREQVIADNLPLVRHVARRFLGRGQEADDLFQLGVIGLMKAIDRFQMELGYCFSTYAVPMIMGEIRRFLRDDQQIKVGRANVELAYKIKKAQETFIEQEGREPSIGELSEKMGIARETLVVALSANQPLSSLQEPVYQKDGNAVYLQDQIADHTPWQEESEMKEALLCLDSRLRKLILLRYYHGKTQAEAGKLLGISQVQVSRLEKKALAILKMNFTEKDKESGG